MRRAIGRFFAWIGALVVLGGLIFIGCLVWSLQSRPKMPNKVILEVDLETGLVEHVPNDPLAKLMGANKADLRELLSAIQRAETDPRVVGLVARLGVGPFGMANIQELRDAITHFRSKNKFAVAFTETFGFGTSSGGYYLATAFDTIWLQPSGEVGLAGFEMESPFFRGTLDKLGIIPQLDHRKEYKTAMNMLTEKKFTPEHKESVVKNMNSWFSQMVHGIAEGRHLTEDQVRTLVDQGPFLAKEALVAKLVDQLGYRDDCYTKVKQMAGSDAELLYPWTYAERLEPPSKKAKTLALIYGLGAISQGKSHSNPLSGQESMGSDSVSAAFRAAIDDPEVKAIVFRIDSPGGSPVASDTIWREVVRAKEAGKPVIVSMGNVAGSGGYWVAMAATKIVAEPGTLTGSIGVFGGKVVVTKPLSDLGITFDGVHVGQNATMGSILSPYSNSEWKRLQTWLDHIYEEFTDKVAQGRHLPKEQVLQIAKGRVWTGEDAKANGLVDELGGMSTAISLAKKTADISETEEVRLQIFPREKSSFEVLMDRLAGKEPPNSEKEMAQTALIQALQTIQPMVRAAEKMGVVGHHEILEMDPMPEGI